MSVTPIAPVLPTFLAHALQLPQGWDEEHPSLCWNSEKARSERRGSSATLVNELVEYGEDAKMLSKDKRGWI